MAKLLVLLLVLLLIPSMASAQMQQKQDSPPVTLEDFVREAEKRPGFHSAENMQNPELVQPDTEADQPDFSYSPGDFDDSQPSLGRERASLNQLDDIVEQAMQQFYIPGASLAVAHNGKLVYAKGFGVANLRTREPVTPTTLFNLASCTKAVSMFGVLKLVEAGRMQLDDTMYSLIGRPNLVRGMQADPRVAQITVRQLLHHSAGWNDDSGYARASRQINRLAPNGLPYREAVRVLLATPLDYAPGTQAKYANGDWNLIKYIIECVAQEPYGRFMKNRLGEIGIRDMCEEMPGVIPGQASRYGGYPPHIIQGGQRTVPLMPDFGNWMASSVDMVKFLTAIDGTRMQGITLDSFHEMIAPLPPPMQNEANGSHFGLGMDSVRKTPQGVTFTKNGGKPGVHCQIVHMPDQTDFCLMFNGGSAPDGSTVNPLGPTLKAIKGVINNINEWPNIDLFESYQ